MGRRHSSPDAPSDDSPTSSRSTFVLNDGNKPTLSMAGARLVVLRGPDKGRALELEKEEVCVGCAKSCDLVLTDPSVSRNHLSLRVLPDGYLVTDLESTNGVVYEGCRIKAIYLQPGKKLELGNTQVRLEELPSRVELELSSVASFGKLHGRSAVMRRTFALLETVAQKDTTVLVVGETGTGKDLAAESIHYASPRAGGPFVVIDCGAIVPSLFESELFGHEKGAFTGASARRVGALVEAHGGTLFLDEVAKLPYDLQPKLLRALDRREVRPIGAARPISVDVRVIAASDRDLRVEVNKKRFREDLFYRLNVVCVRMPPLRERNEDIPLLVKHFLRQFADDSEAELPSAELGGLMKNPWPGNVRELRNRIERHVALAGRDRPAQEDTGEEQPQSYKEARARVTDAFERQFLNALLLRAEGNLSLAARMASMDRTYLMRLLRKHDMGRCIG
jgi:DNA-binding NtrC family response regulator